MGRLGEHAPDLTRHSIQKKAPDKKLLPPGLTRGDDGRLVIDLLAYDWSKPHWLSPEGRRLAGEDVREYSPDQPSHAREAPRMDEFRRSAVGSGSPDQGELDFDGAASAVGSNVQHDMCSADTEIDAQLGLAGKPMNEPNNAYSQIPPGETAERVLDWLETDPVSEEAAKRYHTAIVRSEEADTDMLAQIARDGRFKWSWEK